MLWSRLHVGPKSCTYLTDYLSLHRCNRLNQDAISVKILSTVETSCTTNPQHITVMELEGYSWSTCSKQPRLVDCRSVREYVFFVFSDFKKNMTFYVFFEMTYQKVVKSHQQKFSPQYDTKEWSLRSMIIVIQFLAPKSHCAYDFIHNRKRNRLTEARDRDIVYINSNLKLSQ